MKGSGGSPSFRSGSRLPLSELTLPSLPFAPCHSYKKQYDDESNFYSIRPSLLRKNSGNAAPFGVSRLHRMAGSAGSW